MGVGVLMSRDRTLLPRGARPDTRAGSVPSWGRCVRLSGAPGAAGQVDADVEVQVLGEQVLEFAAFDDGEPVVTGREGFGFRADPCGGYEHAGCCPFFFHRPGQGAY